MKGPSFEAWTPQRPPADFADRTVRAMLAERPRAGASRRRWLGVVVMAALLGGTSAWAMRSLAQRSKMAEPVSPRTAPACPPQTAAPELAVDRRPEASVVAPAEPHPPAPPTRRAPPGPALQDELPVMVRHPRCECAHDVSVCACLD